MLLIRTKVEGPLEVSEDTALHGIAIHHTTVVAPATLWLHGIANEGLEVGPGATAMVHGIVNGDVVNTGGRLEVYGIVNGEVRSLAGQTFIDPDAIVKVHQA
jgi:hypothetical protein